MKKPNDPTDSNPGNPRCNPRNLPGRVVTVDSILVSVERIIAECGYASERKLDVIVETSLPTKHYTNASGKHSLELYIAYDRCSDNLVIEALGAVRYKGVPYKEALLECLTVAAATAPGVRHVLDPAAGTVQLRVDINCGGDGPRDSDVLAAVQSIHWFTEAWWPQIVSAATSGRYDPNAVNRMLRPATLGTAAPSSATPGTATPSTATSAALRKPSTPRGSIHGKRQPPTPREADSCSDATPIAKPAASKRGLNPPPHEPPSDDFATRAARIANSPGASAPRLLALRAFHYWLDELRTKGQPVDPPALLEAGDGGPAPDPHANKPDALRPDMPPALNPPVADSPPNQPNNEQPDRSEPEEECDDGHDA